MPPLTIGSRIGQYEVVALLGVGGMGEVYRARDNRLSRDVAIKVLPSDVAADHDRLARFEREAQVLAALNHTNIAHIHGIDDSSGTPALVMELVEGPTLAERISKGPIPLEEALPIARQLAEALEAAHEQGIIHRDLKPANIKVRPDGTVKVLDFGLAKALDPFTSSLGRATMSPTLSIHATHAGIILGTAAYMAPEQARGKVVDRRVDIWAYGCVLFEMLTGRRPFEGETITDVIAAAITREPDWSLLPAPTPASIRELLRRCLEKDPQKRLPHIGVARLEIDEPAASVPTPASVPPSVARAAPVWRRALPATAAATAAATVAAVLAGGIAWTLRPAAPPATVTRFTIPLPSGQQLSSGAGRNVLAVSPDGTKLVYGANGRLYIRALSDEEPRLIPGTAIGRLEGIAVLPAFSPDGDAVAFYVRGEIRRVSLTGGASVTVCRTETTPFGLSWTGDEILFSLAGKGVMRVSASGGVPELLVATKTGEIAEGPQRLPKTGAVLFTLSTDFFGSTDKWDKAKVVAYTPASGERKVLVDGGGSGRYLPPNRLAYALGGTLFAVPFDVDRLQVTGGPVPILDGIRRELVTGAAVFGVAPNGVLAYVPGPTGTAGQVDFAFIDAKGGVEPLRLPFRAYTTVRVSPDGERLAVGVDDGKDVSIWIHDLSGRTSMRQLTFGGQNRFPVWSADGARVAFQSNREGDQAIFWQRADGAGVAERLTKPETGVAHILESWSPDGKRFLFVARQTADARLFVHSVDDNKSVPFDDIKTTAAIAATFSPDGRWVAYFDTDASGGVAVFVQPFPATGVKFLIGLGIQPMWSHDGKRLFWGAGAGQFGVVPVTTSPTFAFGNLTRLPRPFLSSATQNERPFDMMPDGRVIALVAPNATPSGSANEIRLVLNWDQELKQRVAVK